MERRNNAKQPLEDRLGDNDERCASDPHEALEKLFLTCINTTLGAGTAGFDIFLMKNNSMPLFTFVAHAYMPILKEVSKSTFGSGGKPDSFDRMNPNKGLLYGNLLALGTYLYIQYGAPIRQFLDTYLSY